MSKAILVMDMPDSCFYCDCCHEKHYDNRYQIEGEKFCGIEDIEVDKYYDSFYSEEPMRPSWCPLRSLPSKRYHSIYGHVRVETSEDKIWNACIDEILDEEEQNEYTNRTDE